LSKFTLFSSTLLSFKINPKYIFYEQKHMLMLMYATRNVYHFAGHTALDNFKYSEMTGEKLLNLKF